MTDNEYVKIQGDEDIDFPSDECQEDSEENNVADDISRFQILLVAWVTFSTLLVLSGVAIDTVRNTTKTVKLDPFCVPQKQNQLQCYKFMLEEGSRNLIPATVYWNFEVEGMNELYAVGKAVSTGNVIQEFTFNNTFSYGLWYDLREDFNETPIMVDIKSRKNADCKHSYTLACPELSKKIGEMKNARHGKVYQYLKEELGFDDLCKTFSEHLPFVLGIVYMIVFKAVAKCLAACY